jgi:hypothetical protein
MTREEFMKIAEEDVERILASKKNSIMNLVARAWAEGKKNAETEGLIEIVKGAIDKTTAHPITSPTWPQVWYSTPNTTDAPTISCMEDDGK